MTTRQSFLAVAWCSDKAGHRHLWPLMAFSSWLIQGWQRWWPEVTTLRLHLCWKESVEGSVAAKVKMYNSKTGLQQLPIRRVAAICFSRIFSREGCQCKLIFPVRPDSQCALQAWTPCLSRQWARQGMLQNEQNLPAYQDVSRNQRANTEHLEARLLWAEHATKDADQSLSSMSEMSSVKHQYNVDTFLIKYILFALYRYNDR